MIHFKLSLADELGVLDDGYDLVWPEASDNSFKPPKDLLMLLNVLHSTETSTSALLREDASTLLAKVSVILRNVLNQRMMQYPTTIAEDRSILERPAIGKRHSMAVQVRLGEKEILASWLHELSAYAEVNAVSSRESPDAREQRKKTKT